MIVGFGAAVFWPVRHHARLIGGFFSAIVGMMIIFLINVQTGGAGVLIAFGAGVDLRIAAVDACPVAPLLG